MEKNIQNKYKTIRRAPGDECITRQIDGKTKKSKITKKSTRVCRPGEKNLFYFHLIKNSILYLKRFR